MTIPDYQTMMRPVLEAFADGATNVKQVLPVVISKFALSEEETSELTPNGKQTLVANRVHWAKTYLSKAGLLRSPKRNNHVITDAGRAFLKSHPNKIDNKALLSVPEFEGWIDASHKSKPGDTVNPADTDTDETATPDERIDAAFGEIEDALVKDVLDAVMSLTPFRFERLVIDLLLAMGYGGGDLAKGIGTNQSADGGIDGIIHEDELGLDAVYLQAKRYATENTVGRPALNAFVGSLTGEGATKGVFVTTSDFSKGARHYVAKVQQRIVLINGDRLARLMIAHEVGVRARKRFVIRSVDEDYFSETE